MDLHEASGLVALEKAGLLQAFKDNFLPGDRTKIMNERAEVFYSDHDFKRVENFGHRHFRPEIDRDALRRISLDALKPGIVAWYSHLIAMGPDGEGWLLHFRNRDAVYAQLVPAIQSDLSGQGSCGMVCYQAR